MHGWTATKKLGVTRKRRKKAKAYREATYKEPTDKGYLVILDLKHHRS